MRELVDALVSTDQQYFSAGAKELHFEAATLSWVPRFVHLPVGCVVHSVDESAIEDPDRWLDQAETAVGNVGGSAVRIYVDHPGVGSAALSSALERRGYSSRAEIAYAMVGPLRPPAPGVAIRCLDPDDDAAWRDAAEVHRIGGIGSGIHSVAAHDWTELMRLRCSSSSMDGWLITFEQQPCGTVGMLVEGGLIRSKNLLVDPRFRRRSVGRSVLGLLWAEHCQVASEPPVAIGAFAADGTAGSRFYPGAGLATIGFQVEWSKPLS